MDDSHHLFSNLDISDDDPVIRATCSVCDRPSSVCWCPHLSDPRVSVKNRVIVLQHPNESKRAIRTCRMLELGLQPDCCTVVKGRKFPGDNEELQRDLAADNTFLLYPGKNAIDVADVTTSLDDGVNLVILDGTWDEAKKLFAWNPVVQKIPQVKLCLASKSEYVVRTQPADG